MAVEDLVEGLAKPTPKNPYSIRRVHFSLALVQIGNGGFQVLVGATLVTGFSPFVFSIYRNGIAFLLLAPFAYFMERKERPDFTFFTFLRLNALAFSGIVGCQLLLLTGISLTSAMFAAVSQNLVPVFTFVLAALFGLEVIHIRRRDGIAKVVGTVICVGGAVLMSVYKGSVVIPGANARSEVDTIQPFSSLGAYLGADLLSFTIDKFQLGGACLVLNCLCWAAYLSMQAPILRRYPAPLTVTAFTYLFGVLQVAVLAAGFEGRPNFAITSRNQLISLMYAAVIASCVNFLLQTWCIQRGGAFIVSLYTPIQMMVVAVLSVLFLGDPLYMGNVLGGMLTVAGLYLVVYGQGHERRLKRAAATLVTQPALARATSDLEQPLLS